MQSKRAGYSLVEVLIAVAVTGFVLLTVVTLFYMGRRNVYSGKQTTYAVSVGTRILEDLSSMQAADVLTAFNITDTTPLTPSPVVNNVTYANSWKIDSSGAGGANDPQGFMTNWNNLVGTANLANASVGLIITPRNATNNNAPWTTAQFVKIRAYVKWDEGQRTRYATFDTTKICRSCS